MNSFRSLSSRWRVGWEDCLRAGRWLCRDRLSLVTAICLVLAFLVQFVGIAGIFWSRVYFGDHFDPSVYQTFEEKRSDDSVSKVFRQKEAEAARRAAESPMQDSVSETVDRATQEMDQTRARRNEVSIIKREAEKRADAFLRQAQGSMDHDLSETAMEQIQSALRLVPDYLPAIRKLADYYEARHDYAQARFQWERAAVIAQPQTPEMEEIQRDLDRLTALSAEVKGESHPASNFHVEAPAAPPNPGRIGTNELSVKAATRTDLPLQDLYDLCFNLRLSLASRGEEASMDYNDTRVEIVFYDQSRTAGGMLIPLKVLSTIVKPKQNWTTGTEQVLSVKYSVPKGYFRKKEQSFGNAYSFCGYIVNAYYRGKLLDAYAYPSEVLSRYAPKPGGTS